MAVTKIQGMETVIANLNREIQKIKRHSLQGLIRASIIIRRDMDKTQPLIPIDTGNLRASWFVVTAKSVENTSASFRGKEKSTLSQKHNESITNAKGQVIKNPNPFLVMGFSANYAMFVEENVGANFAGTPGKLTGARRAGAGAKFFKSSMERNKAKVLEVIKNNVKIK